MAYGQQRQHARTQLWQTIDSLTRVVETRSYGFAVGENHNQGKEEHLQLAHFEIVLGTHQLSLEEVRYAGFVRIRVNNLQVPCNGSTARRFFEYLLRHLIFVRSPTLNNPSAGQRAAAYPQKTPYFWRHRDVKRVFSTCAKIEHGRRQKGR